MLDGGESSDRVKASGLVCRLRCIFRPGVLTLMFQAVGYVKQEPRMVRMSRQKGFRWR